MAVFYRTPTGTVFYFPLILCLVLWTASTPLPAKSPASLQFVRVGPEEGLYQSSITTLFQDRTGFMWIGTTDGLGRFDGYEMRIFRHDPFDETAIAGNQIIQILEDHQGFLWLITGGGGVNRLNSTTGAASHFHPQSQTHFLSENGVNHLFQDGQQQLWAACRNSLQLYDFASGSFSGPLRDREGRSIPNISLIREDALGRLWMVNADSGLYLLRGKKSDPQQGLDIHSLKMPGIRDLAFDEQTGAWVSTSSELIHVNWSLQEGPKSEPVAAAALGTLFAVEETGANTILAAGPAGNLYYKRGESELQKLPNTGPHPFRVMENGFDGGVWLGSDGGGLGLLQTRPGGSAAQTPTFTSVNALNEETVTDLLMDRSGTLWVGTERSGLFRMKRGNYNFGHLSQSPDFPEGLSFPEVTALLQDAAGQLWIGTGGGGLNRLISGTLRDRPRFRHYRKSDGAGALVSDNVSTLLEDQSGNFWVGTQDSGLQLFDLQRERFEIFDRSPGLGQPLIGKNINCLYEDQYGQLWIGTGSGLSRYDRFTGRFFNYVNDPQDSTSLSDNEVWAIYEDAYSQGRTLWIGTRSGGLNKYDRSNNRFIRYQRDYDDPFSLNNPAVISIFQDSQSNLWFGTYSGGLNRFNRDTQQFTFFTERDGLGNNTIFGILEDKSHRLWMSTNKGLTRFDPLGRSFKNYDISYGLMAQPFNPGACLLAEDGTMYFGGDNGINFFMPDSITTNPFIPPVVITDLQILNRPARQMLFESAVSGEPISLRYDQNYLTVEAAVLDFNTPGENRYAYQLAGQDDISRELGERRFVQLTNLDPGDYRLIVRGANNDGMWNLQGARLHFIIHPPFWQRWWFYLLSALAIGLASTVFYRVRLRAKLNHLVEVQEIRLEENERVRTKAAHDFHDELGHMLTRISLFSEIVKRQMGDQDPDASTYLNRISDTAKALSAGMKDFIWTLDPHKDSLQEVGFRLKDFGDELFDKTGVAFRMAAMPASFAAIRLNQDWRRHLTLIFKEAMTNALKHAECENASLSMRVENNALKVTFEDDGKGLPGKGEPERAHQSRGYGLNSMENRARRIGGSLGVGRGESGGTFVVF
nr:two-component regulator propeller domain-containing protein [Calditrichia bacterium]